MDYSIRDSEARYSWRNSVSSLESVNELRDFILSLESTVHDLQVIPDIMESSDDTMDLVDEVESKSLDRQAVLQKEGWIFDSSLENFVGKEVRVFSSSTAVTRSLQVLAFKRCNTN